MPDTLPLLCVDDEEHILKTLVRFCHNEGITLLTAGSAAEALSILEREPVMVIISDYQMPEKNGLDFLNEVVQMATNRQDYVVRLYRAKRGQPGIATGYNLRFSAQTLATQQPEKSASNGPQPVQRRHCHRKNCQMTVATRILFVDDEPAYCRIFSKRISSDPRFVVETAGSGPEALERLQQSPVDIVITDLSMPLMDGIELLIEIKSLYPQIFIPELFFLIVNY